MHSWHILTCKNSVGCCQNHCYITPSNTTVLFEVASPRSMQDISASPMARLSVGPELWATWCLSRVMLVANLASSCHWLYVTWFAVQQQWTVSIPPVPLDTFTVSIPPVPLDTFTVSIPPVTLDTFTVSTSPLSCCLYYLLTLLQCFPCQMHKCTNYTAQQCCQCVSAVHASYTTNSCITSHFQ
jgi:hypothetical protein